MSKYPHPYQFNSAVLAIVYETKPTRSIMGGMLEVEAHLRRMVVSHMALRAMSMDVAQLKDAIFNGLLVPPKDSRDYLNQLHKDAAWRYTTKMPNEEAVVDQVSLDAYLDGVLDYMKEVK